MANKIKLDIEYDYDFALIGISCHEKDYRFCWAINKQLGLEFARTDDYEITLKKQNTPSRYPMFVFINEETYTEYYVLSNKSENGLLIPEQKQTDYFFMIKGNYSDALKADLIKKLREINMILAVYEIDAQKLKSKENLLF